MSSEAANPHAPSAIARIPIPRDSASDAWPTLPFFVVRARARESTTRASAYVEPRRLAMFNAQSTASFIEVQIYHAVAGGLRHYDVFGERLTVRERKSGRVYTTACCGASRPPAFPPAAPS